MKIAIIFFGLTRNLEKTIESMKKNLFEPLERNNIDYDILIHTYKIYGEYKNIWSGEETLNYKNEDVENLLNPKYFIHDNQEKILEKFNMEDYYKKLGRWTGMSPEITRYLIRNMCLALYSKKQITKIFDANINEYDYGIIIRPDTNFLSEFNIEYFKELNDFNIIIPEQDWYAGCNDRICIAKPNIISYCGKLFDELKDYSEKKSIISERYFLDKLNEKSISILPKPISYSNIRISRSSI